MELRLYRVKYGRDGGHFAHQRMTGMVLNPLAQVRIGVLMPVMIGRRQVMVNGQCRGKRRNQDQQQRDRERNHRASESCRMW